MLNYIIGVLPELDVYGIRQMTMEELFIRLLYEEWNGKIYRVHPVSQEAWQEQKGSTAWFEKLEAYCQAYENQEIPQEAIVMEKTGVRLMRPAMIREYLRDNPLLSMESKILMLNKMLYARYENVITGKVISFTEKERKILDKNTALTLATENGMVPCELFLSGFSPCTAARGNSYRNTRYIV